LDRYNIIMLYFSWISLGYITPYVMNDLLGQTGAYLLLTMLMMSLMSTGSGEVMAVSSIIVYDIYKTYIKPFR
jgi:Na+/proline symporter